MSEPRVEKSEGGLSDGLNKKWGPFPVWLYLVAVGIVIFLWIYLKRQNSAGSSTSTDTGTQSGATVPPFINQVYTSTVPPEQLPPGQDKRNPSHVVELKTAGTLTQIAKRWDMTKDQLIRLNPDLANKYENTGKKVPKGTKIRVLDRQGGSGGGTLT